MGTSLHGRYDELVIELRGWDRLRTGRSEVRVKVDDVVAVRAAAPADLVSLDRERVFRSHVRGGRRALVLDLAFGGEFDRLVLGVEDADRLASDLVRWGFGRSLSPVG
jgi:hypothetical protein